MNDEKAFYSLDDFAIFVQLSGGVTAKRDLPPHDYECLDCKPWPELGADHQVPKAIVPSCPVNYYRDPEGREQGWMTLYASDRAIARHNALVERVTGAAPHDCSEHD